MPKLTTYQRLKKENERLKSDLLEVCMNPNSLRSMTIKLNFKIMADIEKQIMFGNPIQQEKPLSPL